MTRSMQQIISIVLAVIPLNGATFGAVVTAAKPLALVPVDRQEGLGIQSSKAAVIEESTVLAKQNADYDQASLPKLGENAGPGPAEAVKTLRTHYESGQMESQRVVQINANGSTENHGDYKLWDPQGSLVASGHYRNGLPDGNWKRIYHGKDGSELLNKNQKGFELPLISTFHFSNGVLGGEWEITDVAGRAVRRWNFRRGKLHGEMAVYFSSGNRMLSAMYEQGVPTGTHREWTSEGEPVESFHFQNGRLLADVTYRWPDGNLQATGRQLQPRFRLTVQPDWWNGKIQFESSKAIGKPQKVGDWTYYTRQGKPLQKGTYVRGEREGLFTWWYPHGQLQARGEFIAGVPHGEWTWWHANGETKTIGYYHHGEESGDWVRWDNAGVQQEVVRHAPRPDTSPMQPPAKKPSTQRIQRRSIDIPLTAERENHRNLQLQKATRLQ